MVKLASGDMMRFNISAGRALLQVISRDDVPRIEESGYGWNDGNTSVLSGSDVALLLHRLSTPDADGCVVERTSGSSELLVSRLHDELGNVTVVLKTNDIEIEMTAYERDMLVSAIESQAWRLFE
jgi:hypothetical protein